MRFLAASSSNEPPVNNGPLCSKKKVHKTSIINHLGINNIMYYSIYCTEVHFYSQVVDKVNFIYQNISLKIQYSI